MAERLISTTLRDYLDDLVPPQPAELQVMDDYARAENFPIIGPAAGQLCCNKDAYPQSLPVITEKLRAGGVLIVDNMLWHGRIFDESDRSPSVQGVRQLTEHLRGDAGWIISLVPIRDGLLVAYKR